MSETAPEKVSETGTVWAGLPTETEIYILPNGVVVIADLPAELAASLSTLSILAREQSGCQDTALEQNHVAD